MTETSPRTAEKVSTAFLFRGAARTFILSAVVLGWISAVIWGGWSLVRYATAPGAQKAAPMRWPAASGLVAAPGGDTLVMFVHPKCPCSRASVSELNVIMNAHRTGVSAIVVFLRPGGVEEDWTRTDLWNDVGSIPGTTRVVDDGGREADRFGALTSGQVVLYDPGGNLMFSGGITDSRGHAGDNVGRQTVLRMLDSETAETDRHAVYGCPLQEPAEASIGSEAP